MRALPFHETPERLARTLLDRIGNAMTRPRREFLELVVVVILVLELALLITGATRM